MRPKRFVVEGEWTGYSSSQRRCVHRTVHTGRREKYEAIHTIVYTDGTCLLLRVRDALPREKVVEIRGYVSLIRDVLASGKVGRVLVSSLGETK